MLEQQEHTPQTQNDGSSQKMTQLEGIRHKVFMDRYSLKDPSGKPLEFYPEQLWARVARGIASVEPTEELQADWEKRFYEALSDFQFVPGGRILAGAGSGHAVTYYNCMPPDQEVLTANGYRPISEIKIGDLVVTHRNRLRPVLHKFERETEETLYIIRPKKMGYDDLRVTGDHKVYIVRSEWVNKHKSRQILNPLEGDELVSVLYRNSVHQHACTALVSTHDTSESEDSGATDKCPVLAQHAEQEAFSSTTSVLPLHGVLAGNPGHSVGKEPVGELSLSAEAECLSLQADYSTNVQKGQETPSADAFLSSRPMNGGGHPERTNGDGLRLQHEPDWIPAKEIKPGDYVAVAYNSVDLKYYFEYESLKWVQVDEIAIEEYSGIVLDIEVEEDHSFISAGVVVSNCFVIPSPEDSRQGILDNLKIMTEIMARGGGVGINLSSLRPRGSYIKTVNGTASGPCSWAQLYSVATGDVIQQGGSRRGALMIMLDDTHPDIEEFITVKRTPGKIEHANLSVCISDKFMQAVNDDADWNLVWQGEVKKTVRARYLWDLICTSAWESAEPGMVFMDRYNTESNTWYYETIRCVNPCGEQGLPPWGVCNLGALNLAAFVENGQMDWDRLADRSKVAMRFLDNVVDANEYFIEENREAQLGTRRTGLGTMGLADALIKMKVAYGSEASIPVIERIYATIRDAAYEASADIAVEKGPFPQFDREKYMQGRFIKRLPKPIQEKIEKQGIRNAVLLTQAPTGTTSLFAGVSSGIEPVYDFAMVRRDRTGEHILYHPLLQTLARRAP